MTGSLSEAGSAAGGAISRTPPVAPAVNNAIYSNDYIIDEGPVNGGSARIYATYPDTYNPLLTKNTYTSSMFSLVYEGLAGLGPGLKAEYRLAERWAPSVDGLVWHIVLRQGLKWHNGRPLTARDVEETVDRIREYGDACPYAGLISNFESVTAVSDTEIRLALYKENAYTPYCLIFPVIPSYIVLDALDGESGSANLSAGLVGSGPYRFNSFDGGRRLTLTIADTWRERARYGAADADILNLDGSAVSGAEPPYIDSLTFIFYDPAVDALTQFRAENVNLFFSRNLNYNRYKSSSELEIKQYSEREFLFVSMNCGKGLTAAKSVRRALVRMINRKRLISGALNGRGIAAEYPVQPESFIYSAGFSNTPFDPQAARSILENAGFRLDDGVYYGDTGGGWRSLELPLLVNEQDAEKCALADGLADMYGEYGVKIVVVRCPGEEIEKKIKAGDYEAALVGYRTLPFPDMTGLYSVPWQADSAAVNPAHYQNGDADRLTRELFAIYDEEDRQTAFSELISILQDDAPYIGICFRASSLVYGEDMRGKIYPNAMNPLNMFENWYFTDYR